METLQKKRKKLGIIGGMGTRAGALFMQKVIDYSPVNADQEFIEIILHSNTNIPDRTKAILYGEASPEAELVRSVTGFENYNVEVMVMACITAYYYYNNLQSITHARILHPVKILMAHLHKQYPGIQKIGVLASTGAIRTGIFHQQNNDSYFNIITLDDEDQEDCFMQSLYMKQGLKSGNISDAARQLFFDSVNKIRQKEVELIVGGCSEVSILLNQQLLDIPYVDIMDLLAQETVKCCYQMD